MERKYKALYAGIIILVLIIAIILFIYQNQQKSKPFILTTAYFPNSSNYEQYSIGTESTPQKFLANGCTNGITTLIANTTLITAPNIPITAFSIIVLCNTTQAATNDFLMQYNETLNESAYVNVSTFPTPKIGNRTAGFALYPEWRNKKVYLTIFTYNNIVVRSGVFVNLNSTSPAAAISLAEKLFNNVSKAS